MTPPLTRQQIAEKVYPYESKYFLHLQEVQIENYKKDVDVQRKELTSLIRDLQKQTWDQACKAQTKLLIQHIEMSERGKPFEKEILESLAESYPITPMPENI